MNEQTLGQRIAAQRKKLGLSQEALGEKMGVSRQAISKWESDGAVPEIDKLIAMSRLFGVSLGWLLGVEEEKPAQSPGLSDGQLDMIEQIVSRYQSPPPPKKWPQYLAIGLSAAALAAALVGLNRQPSEAPDYSQQIDSLQSEYRSMQNDLQDLTRQLEIMMEPGAEALLLDYGIKFSSHQDENTALIAFSAIPQQWNGETAILSVSREGAVVVQETCLWDGSAYSAIVPLPLADDYEYRFILSATEDSRQFQLLDGGHYEDLASNMSIELNVYAGSRTDVSYKKDALEIGRYQFSIRMPILGVEASQLIWADIARVIYVNGEEVQRHTMFGDGHLYDQQDQQISVDSLSMYFYDLNLKEGDRVELRLEATMKNGMTAEAVMGSWTLTQGDMVWAAA